jgi:hypothetical protein
MRNKMELLKQNLFNVLILIILILGIPMILMNQGFHYSDTEKVITVQITGEEADSDFRIFDNIAALEGVSRLNRDDLTVDISLRTVESVKEDLDGIELPDGVELVVTEVYPGISSIQLAGNILVAGMLFTASLFIGAFYVIYRKSLPRGGYSDLAITAIVYTVTVLLSAFVQVCLLSIFSRIYQIRQLDIITILITMIWSSLLFVMVYLTLRTYHRHTLDDLIDRISTQNKLVQKRLLIPGLLLIVPLYFGLGVKFVIPGIFLYSAFLIPVFASDLVVYGYGLINDFSTKSVQRMSTIKKPKETIQVKKPKDRKAKKKKAGRK